MTSEEGPDELVFAKSDWITIFVPVAVADRMRVYWVRWVRWIMTQMQWVNPAAAGADEDRQGFVLRVHRIGEGFQKFHPGRPVAVQKLPTFVRELAAELVVCRCI